MKYSILSVIAGVFVIGSAASYATDLEAEKERARRLLRQTESFTKMPDSVTTKQPPIAPVTEPSLPQPNVVPGLIPGNPVVANEAPSEIPEPTVASKRLALLVGINDYQGGVDKLRGAVNDAKKMQQLLTTRYEFDPANVKVLLDGEATHAAIVEAFQKHLIDRADSETIVVFHFSGRGSKVKDDNGNEFDDLDETLVAVDSRTPDKFDITDDEINGLFTQLTTKTKNVTFVIDCGQVGAVPSNPTRSRSWKPDTRPRQPIGADPKDKPSNGDIRFKPSEYVLVASSAGKEESYEFMDPELNQSCGCMTYFFVREVSNALFGEVTYRDMMERVCVAVAKEYPSQHPQLEGAPNDRLLLDTKAASLSPFVVVHPSIGGIELDAGAVNGFTTGSKFEIYPAGTKIFEPAKGLCMAELTDVQAFASRGILDKEILVPDAARAVLRQRKHGIARTGVYLSMQSANVQAKLRERLEAQDAKIHPDIATSPRVRDVFNIVSEPESSRFIVKQVSLDDYKANPDEFRSIQDINVQGDYLVTMSSGGSVLGHPVLATSSDADQQTIKQLVAWDTWRRILDLNNADPTAIQASYSWRRENGASIAENQLEVVGGTKMQFQVMNDGAQDLYVAILDLSTTGTRDLLYPMGESKALAPGQAAKASKTFSLPSEYAKVRHFIKVIYATRPIDFNMLSLQTAKPTPNDSSPLAKLIGDRMRTYRNPIGYEHVDVAEWRTDMKLITIKKP